MGKISQHRTFVLEYIKNFYKSKQATRVGNLSLQGSSLLGWARLWAQSPALTAKEEERIMKMVEENNNGN